MYVADVVADLTQRLYAIHAISILKNNARNVLMLKEIAFVEYTEEKQAARW